MTEQTRLVPLRWDDCEDEADSAALIARKSQPDAKGRYHCVCCGRFAEAPDPRANDGQPRCEEHDFSWPGGMNYAEYRDLVAFAEGWR